MSRQVCHSGGRAAVGALWHRAEFCQLAARRARGCPAGQPATPKAGGASSAILRREGDILSFRSLYLDIGEIDVQTDGAYPTTKPSVLSS